MGGYCGSFEPLSLRELHRSKNQTARDQLARAVCYSGPLIRGQVSKQRQDHRGGIELGVVNLDNAKDDAEAFIFACVMRFPPEDEVYFAVLVRKDRSNLLTRLASPI